MILLRLFWEFFKIGLFAIGGGMTALPFLQDLAEKTGWYSQAFITDMIAISESTPGPIGINMATYVGCNVAGLLGGVVATLGMVAPSLVIVLAVCRSLERFRSSTVVEDMFYCLRPAVTGLIAAAGIGVAQVAMIHVDAYRLTGALADLIDLKKLLLFAAVFVGIKKLKWHPVAFIALSAVVGIVFAF